MRGLLYGGEATLQAAAGLCFLLYLTDVSASSQFPEGLNLSSALLELFKEYFFSSSVRQADIPKVLSFWPVFTSLYVSQR